MNNLFKVKDDIKKWIEQNGEKFLAKVGIKKGQTVLDFGSGEGNYTIPASKLIGSNAKVYAVDKDEKVLNKLKRKLKEEHITNVELIKETKIPVDKDRVDAVLCYDVIHLVGKNDSSTIKDRVKLYRTIRKIVKQSALFSIYPTHLTEQTDVTSKEDIRQEIEQVGFKFEKEIHTELIHDDNKVKGCILNFRSC